MPGLYQILYCSRNTIPGGADAITRNVETILAVSRRNNARQGVTGGLLYNDGCFAQVLEGPVEMVEQAFERIQCDERHDQVTVLQAGPIAKRAFGTWSMAFAGNSQDPMPGFRLADAFGKPSEASAHVLDMLKSVVGRETSWLHTTEEPSAVDADVAA